MEKIIIIGNGFDIAHSLDTSYSQFLSYLADSTAIISTKGNVLERQIINGERLHNDPNYITRCSFGITDKWLGVKYLSNPFSCNLAIQPKARSIYFKSLLDEKEKIGYWSDLEKHYYNLICQYRHSLRDIKLINEEFEHLKKLLHEYLQTEVEEKLTPQILKDEYYNHPIMQMLENGNPRDKNTYSNIHIITFNYTSIILNQYMKWLNEGKQKDRYTKPIHIHGSLSNATNPIIFGYGDENAKDYKDLELIGMDELLVNFKTFQYSRTSNYTHILGLLEKSEEVYVQLLGHSCGLCDKALLKTIFQHPNVKKIEPAYYNDESTYFGKLYNISRIFDDNSVMREKIVPLANSFNT